MSSANKESASDLIRAKDAGLLDIWALPSFDPHAEPEPEPEPELVDEPAEMEEVPLEEVQPLTLEERDSMRQEAWNEGFASGEKEGCQRTELKVGQEVEDVLAAKVASLG
ncbi:flagellar assembly protein FliH, partial [Pseudomonas syringae]